MGQCAFSSPVTFGDSVWVRALAASSKGTVSSVPARVRADSGTNLIMQRLVGSGKGPSRFGDESNYAASRRFRQGSEQIWGRI